MERPKGVLKGYNTAIFVPLAGHAIPIVEELQKLYDTILRKNPERPGMICKANGKRIDIWTLHNQSRMLAGRGYHYGTIVIDECSYARGLKPAWEAAIQPTLADDDGDAIFGSTPHGTKNDFFWVSRMVEKLWQGSTRLNPAPNVQAFYARRKRAMEAGRLSPKVFRQEYEGEFVDVDDALVMMEHLQYYPGDKAIFDPDAWTFHMAVDLAISEKSGADYTALVCVARNNSTGRLYVVDVERGHYGTPMLIRQRIKLMAERWKPTLIAIEAVQFQNAFVIEFQAQEPGLPIVGIKPEKDKITRFYPVSQRYHTGQIWHSDQLIPQFEQELLMFPNDEHDDLVDALTYCIMSFEPYWLLKRSSGEQWDNPDFRIDDDDDNSYQTI